ncbi:hypothetical protein AMJ87_11350 [candidate division WOR_3 bacterium SM23_60]|uniref:Uncharacterized protein n=1 Tax=candidate division WOR_3 bacterium SM23_60 TaxID=1703780 RepID=A0A0S8G788_UNCW3|nr:MAG: hypothetical protein AMJ87_11350 [candidate division WOR_3 bacterium SM23_60]
MARKKFCTITAKDIQVEANDKTLVVHLDTKKRKEIIALASGIFQALAYAKGIDITISIQKPVEKGLAKLTVRSHR